MIPALNDVVRLLISRSIRLLGIGARILLWLRIRAFRLNQRKLKRRFEPVQYRERSDRMTPRPGSKCVDSFGRCAPGTVYATTSGSTGTPKKLPYTRQRVRLTKLAFIEMFAQVCLALKLRNTSLYIFSSFQSDESLSSLLLKETRLPGYFVTLQAPYRVQHQPQIQELAQEYGPPAVRLWLLTISNPAVLYATNPSTLSTFFEELQMNWPESKRLVTDWIKDPRHFHHQIRKIARRLDSVGSAQRLRRVSDSNDALPVEIYAPRVSTYICWTGGYVKPFLDRLAHYLPAPRYQLVPMYSMSTETIETVTYFKQRTASFLPVARGVLYEFMDRSGNVLNASELQQGETYTMIVSDGYGLRRYRTEDQFLCAGHVSTLPDLHFVGRATIEYSFTGEKLTSLQVGDMFQQLRQHFPIPDSVFLSCLPSASPVPHYKIVLIGPVFNADLATIEAMSDKLLMGLNREYECKRLSARLGAVKVEWAKSTEFAKRVSEGDSWETQFKFLPFYRKLW